MAEGYYPAQTDRIDYFTAGFRSVSSPLNESFIDNVRSLIYKIDFNSSIGDVLAYEFDESQRNAFDYSNLPRAGECAGQDIKYYWRYLNESKMSAEIYAYLRNVGLKDQITKDSYVVYLFKDNKLLRIALRMFSNSPSFETGFFKSLGQDTRTYPYRFQISKNGLNYISGSSFSDVKSTEIYICNSLGYHFCIHDWWH